jgi:hypothetical protein
MLNVVRGKEAKESAPDTIRLVKKPVADVCHPERSEGSAFDLMNSRRVFQRVILFSTP